MAVASPPMPTPLEIAALPGMQERHDQPRACRPDRVTQRHAAGIDVQLVGAISGPLLGGNVTQVAPEFGGDCIDGVGISS